jgi:hypothetical protein
MCEKAYSDILPRFGVTSCLGARDILPSRGALPHQNLPLQVPFILLSLTCKTAATRIQGC